MSILPYVTVALGSYTIGSVPNGYLLGRARGIDIRAHGSGNIGATNVLRVMGKRWGYAVFALDALKGLLAVLIGYWLTDARVGGAASREVAGIVGGVACVVGHSFPVWLQFRGGKGVATSAGVLVGLMPLALGSILIVWLLLFQLTRYVSVASVAAAMALPCFVALYLHLDALHGAVLLPFSALVAAIVIWRHRSNLQRLFRGTEPRFSK